MKTLIILFMFFIGLVSCNKEKDLIKDNLNETTHNETNKTKRKVIYYATWDEWGRAKKDCDGWGLCNFVDCWFCDNGESNYSGIIDLNVNDTLGQLIIELNPADELQNEAIKQKKIFYIDQDIINNIATIHSGEYLFDPNVGEIGGYKVDITINKKYEE